MYKTMNTKEISFILTFPLMVLLIVFYSLTL